MEEVRCETPKGDRTLDVCETCQFFWIDKAEWGDLPRVPPRRETRTIDDRQLSPALREKIAIQEIEKIRSDYGLTETEETETEDTLKPNELWLSIPAALGLPVEVEQPTRKAPALTTWITGFILLIAGLTALNVSSYVDSFSLIPKQWARGGGITFITSFFLQPGYLPLFLNLYFLLSFGDNVEHLIGPRRMVFLLVSSIIAGGLCHMLFNPTSAVPFIGASGGISGVIAFYVLSFPKAKMSILLSINSRRIPIKYYRWIRVPSFTLIIAWVVYLYLYSESNMTGVGAVSGSGHIAGVIAGMLLWKVFPSTMTPHKQ
tara:strand:- start:24267 stop:25217 length:951 start_codon:yes stop_codon:yes gene_type:complete